MILLVAIILSALVLGCTSPSTKTVKAGDTVSIDYTCRLQNGSVFDTTNATIAQQAGIYNPAKAYVPLSFVVGSNTTIKGFDDAVRGMSLNQTKANVTITPENGYGPYNNSAVMTVPLENITGITTNFSLYVDQMISYNDQLIYVVSAGPQNNTTAKVVPLGKISRVEPYSIKVNPANNTATVDYNYPWAGKTLVCDITLVDLKSK